MEKSKILVLWFARAVLVFCLTICFLFYRSYKLVIEKGQSIEYVLVGQHESFWRGTNHKVRVVFLGKEQTVSISKDMADSLAIGKKPPLFYNHFSSSVISGYHKAMALRVLVILGILLCLSFFIRQSQ